MKASIKILNIEQGSDEWLELRKTKITATDACVIMKASPWKNKTQLYYEKISQKNNTFVNEKMQRGIDLEPIARDLFNIKTGLMMQPKVVINNWCMASLDGITNDGKNILEIKCPGEKDHSIAISGKIPDHYYPQLQHQMYVCDVQMAYYFSFDGLDGVIVEVKRDDEYIEKMIDKEFKFYICLRDKIIPEVSEDEYIEINDPLWEEYANKWKNINDQIKQLEKEEANLRKQLILISGEINCKGSGLSLCKVTRKGNIDYSKIDEIKNIDLEKYRKNDVISWRINQL